MHLERLLQSLKQDLHAFAQIAAKAIILSRPQQARSVNATNETNLRLTGKWCASHIARPAGAARQGTQTTRPAAALAATVSAGRPPHIKSLSKTNKAPSSRSVAHAVRVCQSRAGHDCPAAWSGGARSWHAHSSVTGPLCFASAAASQTT